jgi:hypothetical protein
MKGSGPPRWALIGLETAKRASKAKARFIGISPEIKNYDACFHPFFAQRLGE